MLKNHLKVAFRNLTRQKIYTLINILGLSTGIASCFLIAIFVVDEFSYDTFHKKADNIYKVVLERKYPNHATHYAIIPHSFAEVMPEDFPEIASVVRVGGPFNNVVVSYRNAAEEEKQFEENFVMAADSNFFDMFSFEILEGDADKALLNLNQIVITESTAKKYFGEEEPLGKHLRIFNQDFIVSAVCKDLPHNSHLQFNLLTKWNDNAFGGGREVNFTGFSAHTYIELKAGADAQALETKFPKMVETYAAAQIERDLGKSWEEYKREGNGYRYYLQPLRGIHLDPANIEAKTQEGGNIRYVYFLIAIGALILTIACINFMNLATARSAERAKEVGIRKTMGSVKKQLVSQFLIESMLLSLFATIIAVALIHLALPYFNSLANKHLDFPLSIGVFALLVVVALVVGFLAGSYPAFVLSAFQPVEVMKGKFTGSARGAWLRNGLVVFQFFISIVLMVGTLVVAQQMEYMQNKSLGYDKDHILVVERVFALQQQGQTFLEEVRRLPQVQQVASAFSLLGRQRDFFGAQWQAEGSSEILTTKSMVIDDEFASTVGFEFVEGKGYSEHTHDSLSVILNETAVKTLEITDPVGKKLTQVQRTPNGIVTVQYTVVGVIRDFNFQSLRDEITPLTIQSTESFGGGVGMAYIKVRGKDLHSAIGAVETQWKKLTNQQPFRYVFLDESLNTQYDNEKRAGKIFAVFSALAIIIACVGLFGLAAYTASLRTKEIGIRKVLGASVPGVVLLLSKDFTKLVLIALLLAIPLSWYVMSQWLQSFAYRVEIGPGVFSLAGMIALLISWLTVSYQSVKAAITNPVKVLRSE